MSDVTHIRRVWPRVRRCTCERELDMSHLSHVTHESCHRLVMSHILCRWGNAYVHENETFHTWVVSHESCHTCVTSDMRHATQSCHTWVTSHRSHVTQSRYTRVISHEIYVKYHSCHTYYSGMADKAIQVGMRMSHLSRTRVLSHIAMSHVRHGVCHVMVRRWVMGHPCVLHDSFTCMTWHFHMCDMTWRNLFSRKIGTSTNEP